MENNEIMNYEDIEVMDDTVAADSGSGLSTGIAIAIGAGLACAVGACVGLVKKGIAKYKAKKEQPKHDFAANIESDGEVEDATE